MKDFTPYYTLCADENQGKNGKKIKIFNLGMFNKDFWRIDG
jgi:hypothetical protein